MPVGDCLQSRLLQDCFCGCTSEHSRHYPCCLELGTFQLVSVGFRDSGTQCRRCILQQASLGRSVDETRCLRDQPKSAPASRIMGCFWELLFSWCWVACRRCHPRTLAYAVVGIAWLPISMFWCHLASVGSVLKRHVSHFSSFSCNIHLLLHL